MKRKIEHVGVGEHFTFGGQVLCIPAHGPTMEGMIFAKSVEPDKRLNPPGWWRGIERGTLVEISAAQNVEKA